MTSIAESPGTAELRITHDAGTTALFAALTCLFTCLAFLVLMYAMSGDDGSGTANKPETPIFLAGFAIGAAGCGAWSAWAWFVRASRRRVYWLEGNEMVCADGRKILWREPARNFQRIRWREQRRPTGARYGGYYTAQLLTLEHEQAQKCIEIASHDNVDLTHRVSKQWALTLELPVVRENTDGGLIRDAATLDTPLAAHAEHAVGKAGFDTGVVPPSAITWRHAESDTRIEARISWAAALPAPLLLLAAAEPFLAARTGNDAAGLVALVFAAVAAILVLAPLLVRQVLHIDSTHVRSELCCCGLVLRRRSLTLTNVLRVYNTSAFPDGVVIEGRDSRIRIMLLSAEAAVWLDACVRYVIATRTAGR